MFTVAKSLATKFVFCLGLGTASYYSYGQVQKWVSHDQVKVVENVVEKHVTRENVVYNDTYVPQKIQYEQAAAPEAPIAPVEPALAAAAAPAVEGEAKKEEEKKEDGEKKEEGAEGVAANGEMIVPNQGAPMNYYPPSAGPAPASTNTQDNTSSAANADIPLVAPGALPSPTPSSSSTGSGGSSAGVFTPSTPAATSGALDANDIAALISPMKASFDDAMVQANGLLCSADEGRNNCSHKNHVLVHSLRWGMTEGLKKDVTFTIKSAGASMVEFDFDFKIQNTALAEESVVLSARPTDVLVHTELKDAKTYRVFEFKFADLLVRGEKIKHVQATMAYEVTSAGLVLSSNSELSFTRSTVKVLVTRWDPLAGEPTSQPATDSSVDAAARRAPAAQDGGVFLIADELSFSMSVEKSL